MKRSLVLAAGAVLVAAAVSAFVYVNNRRNSMDDLFNANVEALAQDETGEVVKCYCKVRWFAPNVCSVQGDGGYCGGDPCSNHDGNCR